MHNKVYRTITRHLWQS